MQFHHSVLVHSATILACVHTRPPALARLLLAYFRPDFRALLAQVSSVQADQQLRIFIGDFLSRGSCTARTGTEQSRHTGRQCSPESEAERRLYCTCTKEDRSGR